MSPRKLFLLLIVTALCLAPPALSADVSQAIKIGDGRTAKIVGGKNSAVRVMDAEGKEIASIPIEKDPELVYDTTSTAIRMQYIANCFYSKPNNTLYVVHDKMSMGLVSTKFFGHFISAVNLTTNRVDKVIPVGEGEVTLWISPSGKRVYCLNAGKTTVRNSGPVPGSYWARNLVPPYQPVVNAIDTASNEIVATYDVFSSIRAEVKTENDWAYSARQIAFTDNEDLIVQARAFIGETGSYDYDVADKILVFSGSNPHPAVSADIGGRVEESILSKDERLFFASVAENNGYHSSVLSIDLQKRTSAKLAALRGVASLSLSKDEKHLFGLVRGNLNIPGSQMVADLDKGTTSINEFSGSVAAAILSRDGKLLVEAVDGRGKSKDSIAIVDLEKGTVVQHDLTGPPLLGAASLSLSTDEKLLFGLVRGSPIIPGLQLVVDLEKGTSSVTHFSGSVAATMLSKDERLGFVAIDGHGKTQDSIAVVDLEKGTVVQHDLTDSPIGMIPAGSKQVPWIIGVHEMRALSETGELGARIRLNKPGKPDAKGPAGTSILLDGYPGEAISLGDDRVAILINNNVGATQHKVALVDLKKLQVDAILPTMTAGEKVKIESLRVAGTLIVDVVQGAAEVTLAGLTGVSLQFPGSIPDFSFRNQSLSARPDGRFLYVLDVDAFHVIVIDVQSKTVIKHIGVSVFATNIEVSPDGKYLVCIGEKKQRINMETNELEK